MQKFICTVATVSLLAFTSTKFDTAKATATVNQEQGYFIFVDSKPQVEYDVIQTITSKRVSIDLVSMQAYELSYAQLKEEIYRQLSQKKNKQKFEKGEALIIYPDQQKADVIKFK